MKHKVILWTVLSMSVAAASAAHAKPKVTCSSNLQCNDGNACTDDRCWNAGVASSYCTHLPTFKNDSYSCTDDTCDKVTGIAHTPKVCPGADQCHVAAACVNQGSYFYCPPAIAKANGTTCNDGNPNTVNDVCTNGTCAGQNVGTLCAHMEAETRPYTGAAPQSAAEAVTIFDGLPLNASGYGSGYPTSLASYSNQGTFGGTNSNIAYHYRVHVDVKASQVGTWGFRMGPDLDFGGAILVDGVPIASRWTNLWWNNSFADPTQSLTGTVNLTQGTHELDFYGFEGCCDGPGKMQYTAPGGSTLWKDLDTSATACLPPCASSVWNGTAVGTTSGSLLNFGSGSSFSVATWASFEPTTAQQHILVKGDNTSKEWSLTYQNGQLCFNRQNVATLLCAPVSAGWWHHYAVSYTAGAIVMYEDGAQIAAGNGTIGSASSTPLHVGNYAANSAGFLGEIDDLAIWNKTLTQPEVQSLFDKTAYPVQVSGLVANWPFSESPGATAGDASGHNLALTLSGGARSWTVCARTAPTPDGTSCSSILAADPAAPSGVYGIDPDGAGPIAPFNAYCDMTTDGGGWTLALAYAHTGGQNNALVPGTAPTSPTAGYSHMSIAQMASLGALGEARFYCQTNHHTRTMHFKTNDPGVLAYFQGAGSNAVANWQSGITLLAGHTTSLPSGVNLVHDRSGEDRMTFFPFYKTNYHWGIYGSGVRWECDDYTGNASKTTLHQIWAR